MWLVQHPKPHASFNLLSQLTVGFLIGSDDNDVLPRFSPVNRLIQRQLGAAFHRPRYYWQPFCFMDRRKGDGLRGSFG
jgi:hypothetical protein